MNDYDYLDRNHPRKTKWSPWGTPDSITDYAPGIVSVGTPSHGGFWLSPENQAIVERVLPSVRPWAGSPWYEEDCDWAVVAAVFPTAFSATLVRNAVRVIRMRGNEFDADWWRDVARYVSSGSASDIAARWEADHANDWVRGSMASDHARKGWTSVLTRVCDGVQRVVYTPDWPQYLYTADQADKLETVR